MVVQSEQLDHWIEDRALMRARNGSDLQSSLVVTQKLRHEVKQAREDLQLKKAALRKEMATLKICRHLLIRRKLCAGARTLHDERSSKVPHLNYLYAHLTSTTEVGPSSVPAGGPAGVKVPVAGSTVKTVMLFEPRFATYANRPEVSILNAMGLMPANAVELRVRVPLAVSTAKTEILSSRAFVT